MQFLKFGLPPPLEVLKAQFFGRGAGWCGRARGFQARKLQIILQSLDLPGTFFQLLAQSRLGGGRLVA